MNDYGIGETVIEEIRALAEKHGVDKVLLSGSRARGDNWEKSDIDLAVLGGDFTRFALDTDEETSTLRLFDFVDLSAKVSPALLEEIKKDGVVLYEKV